MKKPSKELTAAISVPMVLSILSQGESYGYDIIQKVQTFSDGRLEWTDGMLYPVLHKLEKKGLIYSEWRTAENGRKRKYYRINEKGLAHLQEEQANWNFVNGLFGKLWPKISG